MRKIFVVEDNPIIARDIRGVLLNDDYEVFIDNFCFEDAITRIQTIKPDLVLLDINLKGNLTGIDIAKYIMNNNLDIPYIYVSSIDDSYSINEVKKTYPFSFIVKPFRPIDLTLKVELFFNALDFSRGYDYSSTSAAEHSNLPYRLKQVVQYIESNLHEKLSVDDLSALTQWGSHHFMRIFSKYMGVTPYQFILDKRISKAKQMLVETQLPVSSIAFDLGFQSQSSFCTTFKKWVGCTPETFRKSKKKLLQ